MTDEQIIAKVRAAAMDVVDIYVPTRGDNIEIVCARAALAMVGEYGRAVHVDNRHAAARILAALRKAVGE